MPASQSPAQTAESKLVLLEGPCIWAPLTEKINTSATHTRRRVRKHTYVCVQAQTYLHRSSSSPVYTHIPASIKTKNRGSRCILPSHHPYSLLHPPSISPGSGPLQVSLPISPTSLPPPTLNRISRPQKNNFLLMRVLLHPPNLSPLPPTPITHLWLWRERLNLSPEL